MQIKLSPRLEAIAGLVPPSARIADVGTDHGYIPVALTLAGAVKSAVASDIRPGPLRSAVNTARECGVADRISFRLCDGLDGCSPDEADTVIIAGMGGETMISILSAAAWTRDGGALLILQPMSRAETLRRWLRGNGYEISRERLVRDGGTIYPVLCASAGTCAACSEAELYTGSAALIKNDPLFGEYLASLIDKTARAISGLERSKRPEDAARLEKMREAAAGFAAMAEGGADDQSIRHPRQA